MPLMLEKQMNQILRPTLLRLISKDKIRHYTRHERDECVKRKFGLLYRDFKFIWIFRKLHIPPRNDGIVDDPLAASHRLTI